MFIIPSQCNGRLCPNIISTAQQPRKGGGGRSQQRYGPTDPATERKKKWHQIEPKPGEPTQRSRVQRRVWPYQWSLAHLSY